MDEIDFTLNGARYQLTRDQVIRAMRRQMPGRIHTYSVEIEGVRFPVKQVLAQALGIPVTEFISTRAQDLLEKLDFDVVGHESGSPQVGKMHVRPSTAARRKALILAVAMHTGDAAPDLGSVLATAQAFADWLTAEG